MLKYNLQRLFRLKGVDKPIPYLMQAGFTRSVASKIYNNKFTMLSTKQLELLCKTFRCTPNDLMEWTPNTPGELSDDQPLAGLIGSSAFQFDLRKIGEEIPYDKLSLFAEKINGLKHEILGRK